MLLFLPNTATAKDCYETMTVGDIRDFEGLDQPARTGYLGIIDYSWSLDNAGDKMLSIVSKGSDYCRVKAIAEGTGCLTFKGNATIIDVGGSYPLLTRYFITVKRGKVTITKIELNFSSISMKIGDEKQLTPTISPNNATDKSVTWSSSNTGIATVSSSGLVTAKATGSTTITCKANDGSGKYGTCTVTVNAAAPVKVTNISLNYSSLSLVKNDTRQLRATVSPSNATDKTVTWTTSNSSVATVSSDGLVTAVSGGTDIIPARPMMAAA